MGALDQIWRRLRLRRKAPHGRLSAARREHGYTLAELVVVLALSLAVLAVPMTFIVISLTQSNQASSRTQAADEEEAGLAQLTRDLRQAVPGATTSLSWGSTSASVSMKTPVPGTGGGSTQQVTWSCSFSTPPGTCTRQAGSSAAVTEITGVKSVSFSPIDTSGTTYSSSYSGTSLAYVGITVQVLVISQLDTGRTHTVTGASNPITLQDGVDLRNNT